MATANQTILSAASFIDSIGINTHAGYSWGAYNNASLVIDDLKYLGVTTVRDSFATDPSAVPVIDALAAAGVKFDFVTSSDLPATGSGWSVTTIQVVGCHACTCATCEDTCSSIRTPRSRAAPDRQARARWEDVHAPLSGECFP